MLRLEALAGKRPCVAVAFSGGMDSVALSQLLVNQRRKLTSLRLIHVDHGLQADSREWAKACASQALRWNVPLITLRAKIHKTRGESPEAAARDARYTLLARAIQPGEVVVTAQHRDDQIETLLLQLLRGAGVPGLAAMPAVATLGAGRLVRPLLGVPRADLETLARAAELRWIDDPSNSDTRYSRNFLRHRVLPAIREHWAGADRALARVASHMAEAADLLAQRGAEDLAPAMDGADLSVTALRALPVTRRRNALRTFIARAGVGMPEASRLNEMLGAMLAARADAQPEVRWPGALMRRRGGRLVLELITDAARATTADSTLKSWRWKNEREFILNGAGDRLALVDDARGPIDLDKLPASLRLRARRGGETLRPGARARTQSLKKLLQAARVPVEERARLPLLYAGQGRLIAVGDRWIDATVAANVKSRRRARLVWKRNA
jgi:tRNA(Ile)-lysidine synthase